MFTIKFRAYELRQATPAAPQHITISEQLSGPWEFVSQVVDETNHVMVHAHNERADERVTFGPWLDEERPMEERPPRPVVYVMNDSGATVAKYEL